MTMQQNICNIKLIHIHFNPPKTITASNADLNNRRVTNAKLF